MKKLKLEMILEFNNKIIKID